MTKTYMVFIYSIGGNKNRYEVDEETKSFIRKQEKQAEYTTVEFLSVDGYDVCVQKPNLIMTQFKVVV